MEVKIMNTYRCQGESGVAWPIFHQEATPAVHILQITGTNEWATPCNFQKKTGMWIFFFFEDEIPIL